MNEDNQERKGTARERLQRERERQKAREKRRRTLIVSAAVVAVLGLAAVVGVLAAGGGDQKKEQSNSSEAGPLLAPTGVQGKDQLSIPVGADDAPSTLVVWEDFRCPVCAQFENIFRDTLHELTKRGELKIEYNLATIIDGNMGGSGSLRAANAAACSQDAGEFVAYHDVLFRNQPPEPDDAFADNDRLIELAGKVKGLDTPAFRSCVNDGAHDSWVAKSNNVFAQGGFQGTPTVLLNGESIFPTRNGLQISPANLEKWVSEANKGKQPGTRTPAPPSGTASPSPTPSPESATGAAATGAAATTGATAAGAATEGAAASATVASGAPAVPAAP